MDRLPEAGLPGRLGVLVAGAEELLDQAVALVLHALAEGLALEALRVEAEIAIALRGQVEEGDAAAVDPDRRAASRPAPYCSAAVSTRGAILSLIQLRTAAWAPVNFRKTCFSTLRPCDFRMLPCSFSNSGW